MSKDEKKERRQGEKQFKKSIKRHSMKAARAEERAFLRRLMTAGRVIKFEV